jgi:hypothetical protein
MIGDTEECAQFSQLCFWIPHQVLITEFRISGRTHKMSHSPDPLDLLSPIRGAQEKIIVTE